MHDINSADKQDVLCHCTGTSKSKIEELVKQGFDDLPALSTMTGIASGCGGCEQAVLDLLARYAG